MIIIAKILENYKVKKMIEIKEADIVSKKQFSKTIEKLDKDWSEFKPYLEVNYNFETNLHEVETTIAEYKRVQSEINDLITIIGGYNEMILLGENDENKLRLNNKLESFEKLENKLKNQSRQLGEFLISKINDYTKHKVEENQRNFFTILSYSSTCCYQKIFMKYLEIFFDGQAEHDPPNYKYIVFI